MISRYLKYLILFGAFSALLGGNYFLEARPSTCVELRKARKRCLRGQVDKVNVTCGRRYYRYWVNELVLHLDTDYESYADQDMCAYVNEEVFEMSCTDFENYRVPLFFCRKQKKEICHDIKQDGFGSVSLKWPKKKKVRVKELKRRAIVKDQYIRIPCKDIKRHNLEEDLRRAASTN